MIFSKQGSKIGHPYFKKCVRSPLLHHAQKSIPSVPKVLSVKEKIILLEEKHYVLSIGKASLRRSQNALLIAEKVHDFPY
jgi:hypothetical protein